MKAGTASMIATAIRTQGLEAPVIVQVVGIAMAFAVKAPTNAADSARLFWNQNHLANTNKAISEIGEQLIFDTQLTAAVAMESFMQRVRQHWFPCAVGIPAVAEWTPSAMQAYKQVYRILCEEFANTAVLDGVAE